MTEISCLPEILKRLFWRATASVSLNLKRPFPTQVINCADPVLQGTGMKLLVKFMYIII